jgi:GNAT superfamily N-acetyltransferase
MNEMSIELRTLTAGERETLIAWSADEGWNPGLNDAEAFGAAGAEHFLGAFVDGEMLSAISAVAYGDDFGFIGLFITRPDVRGRGYGRTVFQAGMDRLQNRSIGLDGVPAQQANYRTKGFMPDYGNTRYSGHLNGRVALSGTVVPVTSEHTAMLSTFDRAHFPAPRLVFLTHWLQLSDSAGVCLEGETVVGFGTARACIDGYKVGPLFANDVQTALQLLAFLGSRCTGVMHIDVPDHQVDFIASLVAGGMTPGFQTARMYRGKAPSINLAGVFAVTSLELG